MNDQTLTFRRYRDGEDNYRTFKDAIFEADASHKCPVYVHRTPPCQGSCPSGHDVRGWLDIVRGIERPPEGLDWQAYAFQRATDSNPFPSVMGRVCPAPCEDGCNRNQVEDRVGINSVEQFIGDYARTHDLRLAEAGSPTGKHVAIVGGGPGGLACAYQLRRMGHACTLFDEHEHLGGMMRYGVPGYRTPRDVLDCEIKRIVDLGVETRLGVRIGRDISLEDLQRDYDAVVLAIGAQSGKPLPVPGGEAPNCVSGIAFLEAFNQGRLRYAARRVVVIGGGDTAMDVVSVARRLGHIDNVREQDRPEWVILNQTAQDVADVARHEGSEVLLVYRRPVDRMPAARHEVEAAMHEGVQIRGSLAPVEVLLGEDGRARALRVVEVEWEGNQSRVKEGTEFDIECDLVVAAIGQGVDFTGMDGLDNGRGLVDADRHYQVPGRPGLFAIGDMLRPHLLTTAIGHARIAAETVDQYMRRADPGPRPKVDVHHFSLLEKLREVHLEPEAYSHDPEWGTHESRYAVHNYEDRSRNEVIPSDELFLGHFQHTPRHLRRETGVSAEEVLGHFEERFRGLGEEEAQAEADRCMSCGMCFECDNCVIFCPQTAVKRTPKKEATMGRYVYTDYDRCIGCHICADVCPTGYIRMGMGE
ncbi:NAD(P)-binding protein [Thioalkalivibrio thiocyanodenitrificans]|uniref:NAD(P)-binding protein n=1 Tax=Thioalkalivibrio thiocyanodenitrificans TaxID=243063 RepID=UPI00035FEF83|nr:NAD(P)-binding protein [Thioalkalivibrio thiocyanodenitrificans]